MPVVCAVKSCKSPLHKTEIKGPDMFVAPHIHIVIPSQEITVPDCGKKDGDGKQRSRGSVKADDVMFEKPSDHR
jgi:hypothetical protein